MSLERLGMRRASIGITFLDATVALYAGIGVMSRSSDASEYYVACRRVPAVCNGMAGTLYQTEFGRLAFFMCWTGGYCLLALFLATYLRKFGQFTIPDLLGERRECNLPRFIGIVAAILCSFTNVVAHRTTVSV